MSTHAVNAAIRNVAIIAHVDHGKTTLVDAMFRQSGLFRDGQVVDERIMDQMDLERERGITIAAKNCAVTWDDIKINIIDTPGHADFGGEVERALSMVDGAILLVDASEGPLPQTRFVLKKTLEAGLNIIVVINKIDRKDARAAEVLDEIYDLFIDLDATEDQLDFPVIYAIGRDGIAKADPDDEDGNLSLLFETLIATIPPPKSHIEAPFHMLVSDLGYSDYLGRMAIGKVAGGTLKKHDSLVCIQAGGSRTSLKSSKLQVYDGLSLSETTQATAGDILVLAGVEGVSIGDTLSSPDLETPLPRLRVDDPTVSMTFSISDSPFSGREGKYVQSARIRDRLVKETLKNVAITVESTDDRDAFLVKGRGEFQMAILIETMRREGFELCVGRPQVIFQYGENGEKLEPIEQLLVDCDDPFMGVVTEKLAIRKGRLMEMTNNGKGRVRMTFSIPSRGLIGYRDEFLTDTKGTGILNSIFDGYDSYRGDFPSRFTGSIVSDRQGKAVPYALFNLEPRGELFITPGTPVYEGMVIGEHNRGTDIDVNACKEKKLTNMRASGKDENTVCSPVRPMTLERALNFIRDDERVEVTPQSIRLRKTILNIQKRKMNKPKN
ncbi:MAG: translational GTPase TypA [Deltaproteobacteria bacterium]|nr:MAG: translational GTPase TypA [Deltaproteobacteria bacterium]